MAPDLHEQHLVLMKGFPATGKSHVAESLSRTLGWPIIDKDDIKDFTVDMPGGNELAYDIMWSVADRQLQLGLSVIVDSPLTYPVAFETGTRLAESYEAHLLVVETVLDEATWRARLADRNPAESAHKIANWADMQALLDRYDGCWRYAIPLSRHIIVDASRPVHETVDNIVSRMRADERSSRSSERRSAVLPEGSALP